jgi:hypothetical protein
VVAVDAEDAVGAENPEKEVKEGSRVVREEGRDLEEDVNFLCI